MHDATMLDATHSTLRALTSKLLGGYMGEEMTGVLTARHSGVWLWFPSNGKKILTCRGTLTGETHQLYCVHLLSSLYPFPNVAAFHTSANLLLFVPHPVLHILFPRSLGLTRFLWPFTFHSNLSSIWCVVICLILAF